MRGKKPLLGAILLVAQAACAPQATADRAQRYIDGIDGRDTDARVPALASYARALDNLLSMESDAEIVAASPEVYRRNACVYRTYMVRAPERMDDLRRALIDGDPEREARYWRHVDATQRLPAIMEPCDP